MISVYLIEERDRTNDHSEYRPIGFVETPEEAGKIMSDIGKERRTTILPMIIVVQKKAPIHEVTISVILE
jgi:hypothetical protein